MVRREGGAVERASNIGLVHAMLRKRGHVNVGVGELESLIDALGLESDEER
jgi:hypothetical protein